MVHSCTVLLSQAFDHGDRITARQCHYSVLIQLLLSNKGSKPYYLNSIYPQGAFEISKQACILEQINKEKRGSYKVRETLSKVPPQQGCFLSLIPAQKIPFCQDNSLAVTDGSYYKNINPPVQGALENS